MVCGAGATCSLVEQTISILILDYKFYIFRNMSRDSVAAASEREDFPKRVAHLSALLHALRDALQLLIVPHPALQEDEPRVLGFRVDAH